MYTAIYCTFWKIPFFCESNFIVILSWSNIKFHRAEGRELGMQNLFRTLNWCKPKDNVCIYFKITWICWLKCIILGMCFIIEPQLSINRDFSFRRSSFQCPYFLYGSKPIVKTSVVICGDMLTTILRVYLNWYVAVVQFSSRIERNEQTSLWE